MRVIIYVLANRATGLGHWYRCLALRQALVEAGHKVRIASDYGSSSAGAREFIYYILPQQCLPDVGVLEELAKWEPDWIVFDLKYGLPTGTKETLNMAGIRMCTLNGVGYDPAGSTDFRWAQDAPERIILRKSLEGMRWRPGGYWFVFGGSNDSMRLLERFGRAMDDPACLVTTSLAQRPYNYGGDNHRLVNGPGPNILDYMKGCGRACVAAGMVSWELAYLGVPQYVFSSTTGHLVFAKRLEEWGLARAWDGVGVPEDKKMLREFLDQRFKVRDERRPDGRGTHRLVEILEGEAAALRDTGDMSTVGTSEVGGRAEVGGVSTEAPDGSVGITPDCADRDYPGGCEAVQQVQS